MASHRLLVLGFALMLVWSARADDDESVEEVLAKYGLPRGLLPTSIKSHSLLDDGKFEIELTSPCYTKIENDVYYAPTITGDLSYKRIENLEGIQAREGWFWLSVTGIVANSDTITFQVGYFSKDLDIGYFASPPKCKAKSTSESFLDWLFKTVNGEESSNDVVDSWEGSLSRIAL